MPYHPALLPDYARRIELDFRGDSIGRYLLPHLRELPSMRNYLRSGYEVDSRWWYTCTLLDIIYDLGLIGDDAHNTSWNVALTRYSPGEE